MSRFLALSCKSILICGFALFAPLSGALAGSFSPIYAFKGIKGADGANPAASLIADSAGNLYGTTEFGGVQGCNDKGRGCGTVFELTPPLQGGAWTEKILHG